MNIIINWIKDEINSERRKRIQLRWYRNKEFLCLIDIRKKFQIENIFFRNLYRRLYFRP